MKEIVDQIISNAVEENASDIHFIPSKDVVYIRCRIDGEMNNVDTMTKALYEKMLSYIKFVSNLDVAERKKSQSGMMEYPTENGLYHVRISTLPQTIGSEAAVLRLIKAHFDSQSLSYLNKLKQMMKLSSGLILLTGPTGSGKSTLMYALLTYARDELNRQIITIEDPVEQLLDRTIQISVNEKADITYQQSFKSILRCDPDIIMIGEIRDSMTAKQVMNAALSGHLVLSTLHASDTIGAVERLIEMGIHQSELKQSVNLITSQRLVMKEIERDLVIESMTNQQLKQLLNGQKVEGLNSLKQQIVKLYEQKEISLSELEKYYVAD